MDDRRGDGVDDGRTSRVLGTPIGSVYEEGSCIRNGAVVETLTVVKKVLISIGRTGTEE